MPWKFNPFTDEVDYYSRTVEAEITAETGRATLASGIISHTIEFSQPFGNSNYALVVSLENTVDSPVSHYGVSVSKNFYGENFTVYFTGYLNSSNYVLNWIAGDIGTETGVSGIAEDSISKSISYDTPFGDNTYPLIANIGCTSAPVNGFFHTVEKDENGFTLYLSGNTPTEYYNVNYLAGVPDNHQGGRETVASGSNTVNVSLGTSYSGTNYVKVIQLESDNPNSQFGYTITSTTTSGFTVEIFDTVEDADYVLNWITGESFTEEIAEEWYTKSETDAAIATASGNIVSQIITDHGGLMGLSDDDHTQYFNETRGDARYSQLGHNHTESDITDLGSYLENVVEDTTPQLGGDLDCNSKNIEISRQPVPDGETSGLVVKFYTDTGVSLSFGDAVYIKSNGRIDKADADSSSTLPCIGVATEAVSELTYVKILTYGFIRDDDWSLSTGQPVYVSTTAGALTQTKPSASGDFVQRVGIAQYTNRIFICPSLDVVGL